MNDETNEKSPPLTDEQTRESELLSKAESGSKEAVAELFEIHRTRLRRMVQMRLDRRLQGRVDPSDVIQETFLDVTKRIESYIQDQKMPWFLWLRWLTGEKLIDLHRQHLGAKMRDAGREVSLYRGGMPEASSVSIAAQLLGHVTSASRAAMRVEAQLHVQQALNGMDEIDREVLSLRHFEMLTNDEAARVLGISKKAASNRYVRALKRLKVCMNPPQS